MDALTGKTVKWAFADGPVAGTTYVHAFGGVTWTIVEGPYKGATAREKSWGAVKVNEKTIVISYLAASGYAYGRLEFRRPTHVRRRMTGSGTR